MFGLEGDKKKKSTGYVFDLEKELKDRKRLREIKDKAEGRVQQIKSALRTGENKEEFDIYGVLLHGYTSLLKVIGRFGEK